MPGRKDCRAIPNYFFKLRVKVSQSWMLSPRAPLVCGGGGGGGAGGLTGMVHVNRLVPLNTVMPASTFVITPASGGEARTVKVTVSSIDERAGTVNPVQVINMSVSEYGPAGGLIIDANGAVVKLLISTSAGM